MDVVRTPSERFADLPAYPYEPKFVDVPDGDGGALRMAFVDEGDGAPVLLLHGEPTWGFLYRRMLSVLVDAGFRCVVPDLVGFGRSDKPTAVGDYSYARHVAWATSLFDELALDGVTLFGQDWGGLIGLRMVADRPDRFARIAVGNTWLPTGDQPPTEPFLAWQRYAAETPTFAVGRIVAGGCVRPVDDDVVAAYDAPFPDEASKAGARAFPTLVPTRPDDPASEANRRAWEVLQAWTKPVVTLFSDGDPITRGADRSFQERVPGAGGQPHATIADAGHFLQEDAGEDIAAHLTAWLRGA